MYFGPGFPAPSGLKILSTKDFLQCEIFTLSKEDCLKMLEEEMENLCIINRKAEEKAATLNDVLFNRSLI